MSSTRIQKEPALPPDTYPVVRVATEFFLRSFEFLGQFHDDVVSGLILMALWHRGLDGLRCKAFRVRELSRRLDLPCETVRRHVRELELSDHCTV